MADTPDTTPVAKADSVVGDAVKALDALLAGPAKADEPETPPAKDESKSEPADKGAVVAKAEKDEAPAKAAAPDAVQQQDLDWAPKSLQPKLSSLDAETIGQLKEATLFKQAHTKLRQQEKPELESLRAKVALLEPKAANWERLESKPEAAAAAFRVLDGDKAEPVVEEDFDFMLASPAERRAYLDRIAEEKASKIVDARLREKVDAPREYVASIQSALESFISDEKADPGAVKTALVKAVALARKTGGSVTAENVVGLVADFYEAPKTNEPPAKAVDEGLGKVASPNGRGSGAVAPPEVPAWKREKRGPRAGAETKNVAHEALRSLGYETTPQGLDAIIESLR